MHTSVSPYSGVVFYIGENGDRWIDDPDDLEFKFIEPVELKPGDLVPW